MLLDEINKLEEEKKVIETKDKEISEILKKEMLLKTELSEKMTSLKKKQDALLVEEKRLQECRRGSLK
ncbi:hypothetical protein MTBBW1_2030026 [Desulfamplus magnetovallimortis]|uniref:Uncharacterized protein n=1 Tax=Desulfamplus magnetovallimortis TaxID=1246637 RepID=A0A1W1HBX7_9BACT|nr:hypothetical protein [Desulfamplus magnetovallimortis]SLM29936.1 hypothetical protein MTBBW1_2030026 [Desulfamplus magnetovallimortis]